MTPLRRAAAVQVARTSLTTTARHLPTLGRSLARSQLPLRAFSTSVARSQNAFHAQLEDPLFANLFGAPKAPAVADPQTLTEKIVQNHAVGLAPGKKVRSGDYVTIQPHRVMTHDNSAAVVAKLNTIGATKINDKKQIILTLDHDVQNKSEGNMKKYKMIEEFAKRHGLFFSPAGAGIGHQIMIERGFAWPGTMNVASDSHSNSYGGVGSLGTPVVRTDAASLWATSKTWWQVPPIAKVNLIGVMPPGVTGKDVIVALCGLFSKDEVLNHCVEFVGSEQTMNSIPIDDRLSISNMTTEWGALSGLFPIDSVLEQWMTARASTAAMMNPDHANHAFTHEKIADLMANKLSADPGAVYAKTLYINLSTLSPFVSGPNSVKVATPLKDLEAQDIKVDKAYLLSCTNGRRSDIAAGARVFRGAAERGEPAKVAPGVKFYVAAASLVEQEAAEATGDWQVLVDAGCEVLPSGCGPCIGLGTGLLEPGEVGISASNRNYKGRMGSTAAKAYLASPEVVAASALTGKIAGPGWYNKPEGVEKVIIGEGSGDHVADKAVSIEDALEKLIAQADSMIAESEKEQGGAAAEPAAAAAEGPETLTDILPGFPEKIEGDIVFCDADNLNTDGIYPGKYTYQDDMTAEQMAKVCMENYDPAFGTVSRPGDILVSGFNFGTGSSREQAATAILARGIPLVVSGSFGNIFSRNSINNALMGVEVPRLIERLRETFGKAADAGDKAVLTRRTGWKLLWDLRRSKVTITEADGKSWSVKVGEMPPNVQEVIAKGGLENWVKAEIAK